MSKKLITIKPQFENPYQELFEDYIKTFKIKNLAEETIRTYYYHHRYFIKFIGNEKVMCSEITQDTVDDYRLNMIDRKLSTVSINSYLNNVSPVIKFGIERGYIAAPIEFKQIKGKVV